MHYVDTLPGGGGQWRAACTFYRERALDSSVISVNKARAVRVTAGISRPRLGAAEHCCSFDGAGGAGNCCSRHTITVFVNVEQGMRIMGALQCLHSLSACSTYQSFQHDSA